MKVGRILDKPEIWIAVSGFLFLCVLYLGIQLFDARGVSNHLQAQIGMLVEAGRGPGSCLSKADLQAWAEANNRPVEPYVDRWSDDPPPEGSALWIDISPPMPFAPEPGIVLWFDKDDCLRFG